MKKRLSILLVSVFSVLTLSSALAGPAVLAAPVDEITRGANATTPAGGGSRTSLQARIQTITNILMFILGAIAVIAIIIGGIRYTTSNGDSSQTKAAKDTILYAVIGLVIAILAYAIVNFVVRQFT